MKEDRQFVTALARGLEILQCFTAQRPNLGTTDIAHITGLPQPTVWRLCHTLVQLGFLVPTATGNRLRIGAPVLALGYAALAELDFAQVMRPHMQQLADQFGGAVAISERHRLSMIYLERCQGDSVLQLKVQIGSRIPIYNSAVGWAYLAGASPQQRKAVLAKIEEIAGDQWPDQENHIKRALSDFDSRGFIINKGIQHPDVKAAAVPVRSLDGKKLLALNWGGAASLVSDKVLVEQIGPALQKLAGILQVNMSRIPESPSDYSAA